MNTSLMPNPKQQFFGAAGFPLVGGKLYTYAAGTSKPKPTYSDMGATVAQTNPIVLNARGEPGNAIYWSGVYRVELRDALGRLIYTVDNFNSDSAGIGNLSGGSGAALVGFTQFGAGAIARTAQDKLRERVSVKDFAAKGDNSTNDTASIKQAISNCFGRELYFPAGTYIVDSEILLSLNSMTVRGEGRQMTAIITTSPTADIFRVTGSDVIIEGMNFQSRVPRTSGSFVNFESGAGHLLSNFAMQAPFNGVRMNCTLDEVRDGSINNTVAGTGSSIMVGDVSTGFDQRIVNVIMDAATDSQPASGIAVFRTYDLRIESCEVQHQGKALNVLPPDGAIVYALHVTNTFFDSSVYGVSVQVLGTGQANNFRFSNTWFGNNSSDGVRLTNVGSGKLSSMHFDNSNVVSNAGNGFTLDTGCEDVTIMGGGIQGCAYGVNVSAGVSDWSVIGVAIGNYAGGGGATQAGITVAPGGSDRYIIQGNRFRGNGQALIDGGTGNDKVIAKNSGLISESRGQATMLVGTQTLDVQHGLGVRPDPTSIVISPNTDQGGNPLFVDANTLNETQFTVRCGASRAGGVFFNWQAKIKGA